ncbi:MAG: histidinol-phosphate transaminase [Bacilli bacterium]|jgi:histidinol-phosphate aminotransferase
MSYINKYLRNFRPYKLASHKIWSVEDKDRKNILKLDWNEATQMPSPLVSKSIKEFVNSNDFYNYYPSTKNEELLKLIANYCRVDIDNIQYFSGSDSLHEYIAKMYIGVGDPVLIIGPTYDNFRLTAEVNGASLRFFEPNEEFIYDRKLLEEEIEKIRPSLIYLCNPNNPTGTSWEREYVESLLQKFNDVMFLVDEAYYEFSGVSCAPLVMKYENILVSRTLSKAFALANFRFGYLIASKDNVNYISSIRNPKNITTLTQVAASAALSDIAYMQEYAKEVKAARSYFTIVVNEEFPFLHAYESHGNFVLIKCRDHDLKMSLIKHFEDHDIFVRNVSQSKLVLNCFRITIGTKKQMDIVLSAMRSYFGK